MTIVSSKEFKTNQDKYLELALNERVYIRKGNHTFFVTNADEDESEYDYVDYIEAKARENDEDTSAEDFLQFLNELNNCQ
jgi:hypothetical protein